MLAQHSLGSSWLLLTAFAVVTSACTTGVQDNGFTGFTGTPQDSSTPGATSSDDETGDPVMTDGVATMGGSADVTGDPPATTEPDPTNPTATTEPDPTNPTATTDDPDTCDPACAADEECIEGVCFPTGGEESAGACNDVPGNYDNCLGAGNAVDTSGCGGGTPTCITGGDPVIAGVCSQTPCVDACDCPASPGGTAAVTCDAITGDGTNFCYLDCSAGGSCPAGMVCFGALACIWEGEGADGTPYGDCFNNGGSICGTDGICLSDDPAAPTVSVCTEPCNVVGDCSPAPAGGTVSCQDVTGEGDPECILSCVLASDCPGGMTCFSGLCMFN